VGYIRVKIEAVHTLEFDNPVGPPEFHTALKHEQKLLSPVVIENHIRSVPGQNFDHERFHVLVGHRVGQRFILVADFGSVGATMQRNRLFPVLVPYHSNSTGDRRILKKITNFHIKSLGYFQEGRNRRCCKTVFDLGEQRF